MTAACGRSSVRAAYAGLCQGPQVDCFWLLLLLQEALGACHCRFRRRILLQLDHNAGRKHGEADRGLLCRTEAAVTALAARWCMSRTVCSQTLTQASLRLLETALTGSDQPGQQIVSWKSTWWPCEPCVRPCHLVQVHSSRGQLVVMVLQLGLTTARGNWGQG